jgi:hypothetical protein
MAQLEFQGNASALSSAGLAAVANQLNVFAAEIWTVLAVETSGCGYIPDRRPEILYERHIFHRLTRGQFDDGDISDPSPGGYGPTGAHQYDRLAEAVTKNREAALQSASWGIGQIMGENYRAAGFQNVEDMVAAMSDSEDQQLTAMANFLTSIGLQSRLQSHDWTSFARGYNGVNYAINHYDVRLAGQYQKYSSGVLPDVDIRAAQLYLTYLGFDPGGVDGVAGPRTMAALARFQTQAELPSVSTIDSACIGQLQAALDAQPVTAD